MNYRETYEQWLNNEFFDATTRKELAMLNDETEIEDRFYCELKFGTGGLRGVMGAGTNRVNKYTIGKATLGLGKYLLDTYGKKVCENRGVVIGYDTRNNSMDFAKNTANVLSSIGIKVFLSDSARPTPQLSFAVKYFNCVAGIVITASHNPKEYNGYKVYDEFGCQLVPDNAKRVIAYVEAVTDYQVINFEGKEELINEIDITDKFVSAVLKQSRYRDKYAKANLKIVYTPLHGTGNVPVREVLKLDGFTNIEIVEKQDNSDGDFPTVESPNPEDRKALKMGIELAKAVKADIVLGTDPDCDRVGIAVKDGESYQLMTGNQIGALLMDFILINTDLSDIKNPAVVKTIVTSELGADIAKKKGLSVFSTLTGFKFIGEKIIQFEQAKSNGNVKQDYEFIFGYEESYGYLTGTHAKDKDAVVASLLICEMAASCKAEGKTLVDKINEIYTEFGYYRDALDSFAFKGKEGLQKIVSLMTELRNSDSPFEETENVIDYNIPVAAESGFGELPISNVLKYVLKDGSWIAIRPSGTEPKIKIYYSIKGADEEEAESRLKVVQSTIQTKLGLN